MRAIFCGIDVSADSCVVLCVDQSGQPLGQSRTFSNDLAGAEELTAFLLELAQKQRATRLEVGLEATSVYGVHLRNFLVAVPSLAALETKVYEINPALVAGFKKSFPKRPKTDSLDAFAIAERVRFGHLTPFSQERLVTEPLLQLTRLRLHLVQTLAVEQNRAYNYIYLKFSNYRREKPFSSVFGRSSLAVLNDYTPEELLNLELEDLAAFILENGNNRLGDPEEYARSLKATARRAYRLHPQMGSAVETALAMTISNIDFLKGQVRKLDRLIARELDAIPQTLTTVPGIGPVLASGIVAEIGDIRRFAGQAALAQYAGLTWNRYQSGNFDAEDKSLTKTGNRYLRYYLVEAANSLRVHNEEYRSYYQAKYAEVTKHQHKRALVLTARKFVRLVYALLSKGQIYAPGQVNI
ncbi:MAG: IS110 family transposase [Thermoanaerobacterales bacterium]|nr:IS110 family transposase [Thermoanaerobacterales bacterium]